MPLIRLFSAKSIFGAALILGVLACLGACSRQDEGADDLAEQAVASIADSAWLDVLSSGPAVERYDGESSLAYFMRTVEIMNVRRRERGLKFWHDFPGDPRRYQWLSMTVQLPPAYPEDLGAWSEAEASYSANGTPVNQGKTRLWEQDYVRLREEFWLDDTVTDRQRRYLWFGELRGQIHQRIKKKARGEVLGSPDPLFRQVLEYIEAYPTPYSESDRTEHVGHLANLLREGFIDNAVALGLSERELNAFMDEVSAKIRTHNDASLHSFADNLSMWLRERQEYRREPNGFWRPNHVGVGNNPDFDSGTGFLDLEIGARKYREIGAANWAASSREEQHRWLEKTQHASPHYFADLGLGAHAMAIGRFDFAVDEDEKLAWNAAVRGYLSEWSQDSDVTAQLVAGVEARSLASELLWIGRRRDAKTGEYDDIRVAELLDDIVEYQRRYPGLVGGYYSTTRFVNLAARNRSSLGLGPVQLDQFLQRLYDASAADEGTRRTIAAVRNRLSLHDSPFEFSARTMEGEPFDISSLRGKIVLVDIWYTSCGSCIAAMPQIHDIFLEYQDRGFEVVSLCFDAQRRRKRVERISKELGLTWTEVDADGMWEEFSERYGYAGAPQYMLLNRDGTLYAGTGEVDMGRNLEALLEEMLAAEATEQGAATVH